MVNVDKIFIKGLELYGYHGVFPAERELGQRFRVDLECYLDLRQAGLSDRIDQTVDYGEIVAVVQQIVEKDPPVNLLESLAEKICSALLRRFPLIQAVMVRMVKPDPPIPGHYEHVGVEIFRRREDEQP